MSLSKAAELRQLQKLWGLREELSTLSFAELRGARDSRMKSLRFLPPTPDVISAAINELCAVEDVIQDKAKALLLTPIPDSLFRILRSQE